MRWSFRTNGNYIDFVHTDETSEAVENTIFHLHNTSRCVSWSLLSDTTRINFTIDETKYANILITDIDFDGTVMNSQDDFETGITAMFTGLAGGGGGVASVTGSAVDNTDPLNPVINSTAGSLLALTTELTDAQIKALPTTAVELVPAQGANKMVMIVQVAWVLDVTAGVYTNLGNSWDLRYDTASTQISVPSSAFLEDASNVWISHMYPDLSEAFRNISLGNNKNLNLFYDNLGGGNLTGGNAANTLKVTVYYVVVDL